MDIIDKAKELGQLIAGSEELKNLKEAEIELEKDAWAGTLMKEYKQLQMELVRASKEKKEKDVLDEIRERLLRKQMELNEYPVTFNYLDSKTGFDRLMKNINDVITFAITGEEPCSPSKCGSCGGGCK